MCGIDGFFSCETPVDCRRYYRAHLLLGHRGPDDEGFVAEAPGRQVASYRGDDTIREHDALRHISELEHARVLLGHRRLAIIDLSHRGHQPLDTADGRYWIVFNGEVFNFVELRQELEDLGVVFTSRTDTEVVLAAYAQWGEAAFDRFNGMWALAIWDRQRNALILSRDRFGIKPLFYAHVGEALVFASEPKFIREFADRDFEIDLVSVDAYLDKCHLNYSERSFWEGIVEVPPAHFVECAQGRVRQEKYWRFEPDPIRRSAREAVEQLAFVFEDSLRLRMRSDVEVGTLLSGGLDSSLVVCGLNALGLMDDRFKTFSAVFEDERFSEKRYVDSVLSSLPAQGHFVYPNVDGLWSSLDEILRHHEQPIRSLAVYSQSAIYETIRRETDVTVLLNGQGGDELFGGYNRHYLIHFGSLAARGRLLALARETVAYHRDRSVPYKRILRAAWGYAKGALRGTDYFNRTTFLELSRTNLREYLTYDDRNSMMHGLEARVPFLDHRLVEFAFSLDESMKLDASANKRLLRTYAEGTVPDDVVARRDKMGFSSPQEIWMRGIMMPELERIGRSLETGSSASELIGRNRSASDRFQDYLNGASHDWAAAWRVYCLHRWLEAVCSPERAA